MIRNSIVPLVMLVTVASASAADGDFKWIDGRQLPIEGRPFANVDNFYDRLPSNVTANVNATARELRHHTAGMQFRFSTDSRKLRLKWTPYKSDLKTCGNMSAFGESSMDVYRRVGDESWRYVTTVFGPDAQKGVDKTIDWTPGADCLVNLPLYDGVKAFALGIEPNASVKPLPPRRSGIDKPVVFYGTSITQGGCVSRPGLSFVNWIGRDLDVPVVNLGFSGSGRMELEMSEHLAHIDASCYVLDCLWNMGDQTVAERYEKFIRNLRAKRPGVPIVMAEQSDVFAGGPNGKDRQIRALCRKLRAEGWLRLVYLPKTAMYVGDAEGSVDTVHPNELGMATMARAYGRAVREALDSVPQPGERTAAIPLGNTWANDTVYRADRGNYDLHVKDTVRVHEARHRNLGFEDPLDTAFHLKGLRNVTLDFGGATLTLHGKIQPFVIDGCTNVTIRNVRVRYARCGYSQAEIVSVDGNTMAVRFDRGKFPYKVEDGALVFTCSDWPDRHVDKAPCFTQFYDGGTRRGKALALGFFDRNPYIDPKLPWARGAFRFTAEEKGDLVVLTSSNDLRVRNQVKPGDVFVVAHEARNLANCFLMDSSDVSLVNYRVMNGIGMGFFPFHCRNLTLDRFVMTYDEDSPSFVSNGGDGIHAVACSGDFIVRDSIVEGTTDDALNVHGHFYTFKSAEGDRLLVNTEREVFSTTSIIAPGERIRVCRGSTCETAAEYVIAALRPVDDKTLEIAVDRPVGRHQAGDAVENLSAQCRLQLVNCRFGKANSHLRFQTRGGVVVENCETELPFLLTGDTSFWFESSPVEKMLMRNVRFVGPRAKVRCTPEYFPSAAAPFYHGDIRLEGCAFDAQECVTAKGTRSFTVRDCRQNAGKPLTLRLTNCGAADAPGCEVVQRTEQVKELKFN